VTDRGKDDDADARYHRHKWRKCASEIGQIETSMYSDRQRNGQKVARENKENIVTCTNKFQERRARRADVRA